MVRCVDEAEMTVQFRDYLLAIARRWWIVALVALAATGGSFFLTKLQPPVYRSTVLLINSARLEWGTTMTVQVLLRQQEQQLQTAALAARVDERMQLGMSTGEIQGKLRAKSIADAITVRLDVEDTDPDRARKIALGYGLLFQEDKSAEYAHADAENRLSVAMLEEPQKGTLVGPNTKMNTLAGAFLGLVLGLALAMILEYLDDTLKTPEQIARELGLVTLALIPRRQP